MLFVLCTYIIKNKNHFFNFFHIFANQQPFVCSFFAVFIFFTGLDGMVVVEDHPMLMLPKRPASEPPPSTSSGDLLQVPSSSMSDECQCDEVLRPMFWHDFLPSYLACQADLVCLLTRMRWMSAKGEINAFGAISTFRKANPSW